MSDLLAEIAGPPRDRWGRYKLPHPHPDQLVAYTQATTVARACSREAARRYRQRQAA